MAKVTDLQKRLEIKFFTLDNWSFENIAHTIFMKIIYLIKLAFFYV